MSIKEAAEAVVEALEFKGEVIVSFNEAMSSRLISWLFDMELLVPSCPCSTFKQLVCYYYTCVIFFNLRPLV